MSLTKGLAIDLEFTEVGFSHGALVHADNEVRFTAENLPDVGHILRSVPLVVGHNIRRFDLPQLATLLNEPIDLPESHLLDTLELAALVWPGRPTQALEKLYRQTLSANDPAADCREALEIVQAALQAAEAVPAIVRYWVHELLPEGALKAFFPGGTRDWEPVRQRLGDDFAERMETYFSSLVPGDIDHLGALVFLH